MFCLMGYIDQVFPFVTNCKVMFPMQHIGLLFTITKLLRVIKKSA
jgi:hypothetical protein